MKKNPLKDEIASLKKSYGHLARFPDGKLTRQLSNRDLIEVNQWL